MTTAEEVVKPPPMGQERGSIQDHVSGTSIFAEDGIVEDSLEPDILSIDEMLRVDGKARSLEGALTLPVRGADWNIVPGQASKDVVGFVTEAFRRTHSDGGMETPMNTVVGQLTGAFSVRRTYHEKVFMEVDWNGQPQVAYKSLAWRPPLTCKLWRDPKSGALKGFQQEVMGSAAATSRDGLLKFDLRQGMVYIHGQHREPVSGVSEMDIPYRNWLTKQKIKYIWFTYLESQSLPRVIARTHGEEEAKKVAAAIAALRNAGVVALPDEWIASIDTLDISGQGADGFRNALEYCDHESAISMLAGFTELGGTAAKGMGSYALSKDQSDFFLRMQLGFAKELSYCVTTQAVADLVRYNFGRREIVPMFEVGPLNPDDIQTSLDLLKLIATATQVNLPDAFVSDLVMQVAKDLGMDLDKIAASVAERKLQLQESGSFGGPDGGGTTAPVPGAEAMANVAANADVGAAIIQAGTAQQAADNDGAPPAPDGGVL